MARIAGGIGTSHAPTIMEILVERLSMANLRLSGF
jgi:hypothetical protein